MSAVVLYRIDPAKGMRRFYRLEVQNDLFGQACFMRKWGRIFRREQVRTAAYPTTADAEAALERCRRSKERRGYMYA